MPKAAIFGVDGTLVTPSTCVPALGKRLLAKLGHSVNGQFSPDHGTYLPRPWQIWLWPMPALSDCWQILLLGASYQSASSELVASLVGRA